MAAAALLLRILGPGAAPETTEPPQTIPETAQSGRGVDSPQSDATWPAPVPSPAPGPRPAEQLGVVFVRPARGTLNFPDALIEIRFTHPMDIPTVEAAFTLEPSVEGAFAWPSPSVLTFVPARPFVLGSEVSVRLGAGMRGAGGGRSLPPFSWSFPIVARYAFGANVGPWLRRACRECHGPEGIARSMPLATYEDLLPLVNPGRAAESRLIGALGDSTHRNALPAAVLARRAILAEWIESFQAAP